MEYPHRPYLTYLLSRRMTVYEILADCEAKHLVPPTDPDLRDIARDLGSPPAGWVSRLSNAGVPFRRWLRDKGLSRMWKGGPVQEAAERLLYSGHIRVAVESLLLTHGDPEKTQIDIGLKYGKDAPTLEVVTRYRDCFWDLGGMSRSSIFDYLQAAQQEKEREPALKGDIATVYGQLGMRQRIEAEQLYDNLIALANQQLQAARREPGLLSGSQALGLAALGRQAIDAAKERAEIHSLGGQAAEDIKKQAIAFKLRSIATARIIGIDELDQVAVIEEDEDASNVRRFPHAVPR